MGDLLASSAGGRIRDLGYRSNAAALAELEEEQIRGPQAASDSNSYRVWLNTDEQRGPAGRGEWP